MHKKALSIAVASVLVGCGGGGNPDPGVSAPTIITESGERINSCSTDPKCSSQVPESAPTPTGDLQVADPESTDQKVAQVTEPTPKSHAPDVPVVQPPVVPDPTPPSQATLNRSTVDRPDDESGAQIHLIYAVPRNNVDRGLDLYKKLSNSITSVNNWLKQQTDYTAELKLDTYQGEVDITYVNLPRTATEYDAAETGKMIEIQRDLRQANQMGSNKIYLIYYDGDHKYTCGDSGSLNNGHQSAVVYLQGLSTNPGFASCDSGPFGTAPTAHPQYLDYVALHEILHVINIPHVSDSEYDLMYGGNTRWDEPEKITLDLNDDHYAFDRSRGNFPRGMPNVYDSPFLKRIVH